MKKILSLTLILLFVLTSCQKEEVVLKKFYKTFDVTKGSLNSSDSILSTLEGKNTSNLAFKAPGRIEEVFVKVGDEVRKGEILAKLGNEEGSITYNGLSNILSDINGMGIDIQAMGGDTKKIKDAVDKLYDERLKLLLDNQKKSKIAISMAEKDLLLAKKTNEDTSKMLSGSLTTLEQKIRQAENAYKMAQNNLDNSKKLLEQEKENINKNSLNSLSNAYIISRNSLDYVDNILGVTEENRTKNDNYEVYLGAKNATYKSQAENLFREFNAKYQEMYKYYQENIIGKTDISEETIKDSLQKALIILELQRNLLHSVKDMLDSSITSAGFDENTLGGMKTQISTLMSNLEMSILSSNGAGVKGSLEAINSFAKNYDLKIKQLEDALIIAEEDVKLAKTGQDINVSDVSKNRAGLETNVKIKEDSLELAKLGEQEVIRNIELVKQEKVSKLAEIDANLSEITSKLGELNSKKSEAAMNKNLASESIESGIIRAPFDGIILDKMFDKGMVVGAGTPVFSITSNDIKLTKTYIDNSIYNLKIGDNVKLRNSKNGKILTGAIFTLSQTQDITKKKNYVEIILKGENGIIGDRLTLLLDNSSHKNKEELIIIPSNSIISKYSKTGVYAIKDNITKFKFVEITGSDDEFSSIKGLQVGEKIITEGKDNILDGEVLK